jgi:hypothetical protein
MATIAARNRCSLVIFMVYDGWLLTAMRVFSGDATGWFSNPTSSPCRKPIRSESWSHYALAGLTVQVIARLKYGSSVYADFRHNPMSNTFTNRMGQVAKKPERKITLAAERGSRVLPYA